MAILRVCSAYDSKAECYGNPIFVVATGVAIRGFTDEMSGDSARHRGDYQLYHVADFESDSGVFTSVIPPRLLISGIDVEVRNAVDKSL